MPSGRKEHLINTLDEVSSIKELQSIPGFSEEAARIRERLSDDEFRIAVVGEFSSGKSTFINAILGQDILQHATTETTAAITQIINVAQGDPRCMTGRVKTRSGKEIHMEHLRDLKEFTTTQSERYQNRVPEEIASVEVYVHIPFMDLGYPIVLTDTPGLNGVADGHREQTVELVQKAHACIYLIPRSGLGESDILFLDYLARFQKNFVFIQNFIDELQASQGDSVSEKLAEQRGILDEKIFSQNPECVYDICGISALMELASADLNIERLYADSPDPLTPEERRRLHEQSGFEGFRRIMAQTFKADRIDELRYGGTARAIVGWLQSLLDLVSREEQQAREFFEASSDKHSLDKLDRLREKILTGEQRRRENLQNFIISKVYEIRREECGSLEKDLQDLNSQMFKEINAFQKIADLESFEKTLPGLLENKTGAVLEEGNVRLGQKFQAFYQVLLAKIDEYSGTKSNENLDLEALKISAAPDKQQSFTLVESRLNQMKNELESRKNESSRLQKDGDRVDSQLREAQNEESGAQRAKQTIEMEKDRELKELGSRPAAKEHEEPYKAEVPHSGPLGWLGDKIFGWKTVTRYRTVRDDSEGARWDQKRAQIQNAYVSNNDRLSRELAAAQRRKNNLLVEKEANQTKLRSVDEKIRQLKSRIKDEGEKLELEKRLAAQEYLDLRKTSLREQVQAHLLGESGVLAQTKIGIASVANEVEQAFIAFAMARFTTAIQQKLGWIEQEKQGKRPEILRQVENLGGICKKLQKMLDETEQG